MRILTICKKVRKNERIKGSGGLVSIKSVPGSKITDRGSISLHVKIMEKAAGVEYLQRFHIRAYCASIRRSFNPVQQLIFIYSLSSILFLLLLS
jgi:hypothetical protein